MGAAEAGACTGGAGDGVDAGAAASGCSVAAAGDGGTAAGGALDSVPDTVSLSAATGAGEVCAHPSGPTMPVRHNINTVNNSSLINFPVGMVFAELLAERLPQLRFEVEQFPAVRRVGPLAGQSSAPEKSRCPSQARS